MLRFLLSGTSFRCCQHRLERIPADQKRRRRTRRPPPFAKLLSSAPLLAEELETEAVGEKLGHLAARDVLGRLKAAIRVARDHAGRAEELGVAAIPVAR